MKPLFFIFDPNKRVYWLYLLSALILAIWFYGALIFKKQHWINRSSVVDLVWIFVNQGGTKLLLVPMLAMQISFILWLNQIIKPLFGEGNWFYVNESYLSLGFAFILFISHDFSKYLLHLAQHKVSFLWRFHAVHHSATSMTPLTLYRIHPVEFIINALRSLMVNVLLSVCFIYLFKNNITVLDLLGVNLFVFLFNVAGSNLRHSHIWLGFGKWERFFISPAQHQIHHSAKIKHFNKNFGSTLAIWDALFNSLLLSKNEQVKGFGLDQKFKNRQTLKQQWSGIVY
ncbi:sterol desaturase family protein [Psychromonas sp. MB-3u-54]|uniref:sterol desaturase family protein n=1 Tax=Psychromonas sp. MB-3u-54 TaxID=2058319 RepID=UPI000C32EDE9|nr:sterol desaturase family protein [Psychromonas sp. MB-3u-54]PKH03545.1 sterol desaturase family protein [Psychromonas sp. MB-3u-54]